MDKYTIWNLCYLLEEYSEIDSNHANCCRRRASDDEIICCEDTILHFIDFISSFQEHMFKDHTRHATGCSFIKLAGDPNINCNCDMKRSIKIARELPKDQNE